MMQHVLFGYGYCASRLAHELTAKQQDCLAISRQPLKTSIPGLEHQIIDLSQYTPKLDKPYVLYYFIPPSQPSSDPLVEHCLDKLQSHPPIKIIYIGSSGIYGDHNGRWVNESSSCVITTPRQQARFDAEQKLETFAKRFDIVCTRLRVAGIYGPGRIPIDAAQQKMPVIVPAQAPHISHIYVNDLANILALLGTKVDHDGAVNIADGHPTPMGYMQQLTAQLMHLPKAPELSFDAIWQHASPMKREFMSQNKKLDITMLQGILSHHQLTLTPLKNALKALVASL